MIMKSEETRSKTTTTNEHTFVVCAYGTCVYLEKCVISLLNQNIQSTIIMVTSTPNDLIQSVSKKYNIPLFINEGESGITQDWNFALSRVKTKFATIAHQDDEYKSEYTEKLLEKMNQQTCPIIGFSDYAELHENEQRTDTKLIRVKKLMLFPLRAKILQKSRFIRRRSLSFGCAICCPSVMFCLENVEQPVFKNRYTCCEDWEAWEKLSRLKGSFVYVPRPLMSHRIHEESVTTKTVKSTGRKQEDYEMYRKFWPTWIAKMLIKRYSKAEEYNKA